MTGKPKSKVLQALEREMLWELDSGDSFDGWVVVCRIGSQRPRPLPWTFSCRKDVAYDTLLLYGHQASQCGIPWAKGWPVKATRAAQLRWLRRRGLWVQKAVVKAVE